MPLHLVSQHRANQNVAGDQLSPSLLVSPLDDVVAIWSSLGRNAQIFDADGNMLGSEIALPTITSNVGWLSNGDLAVLTDSAGVQLQRYDRTGVATGGPTALSTSGTADDIVALASGNVLATYRVGNQIRGRILDASFAPHGGEFLLRDVGSSQLAETIVTPLAGGGFAMVFDFGAQSSQRLNLYDANGNAVAFSGTFSNFATKVDAVALADGGFVLSYLQPGDIFFPSASVAYQIINADGSSRAAVRIAPGTDSNVTVLDSSLILFTWEAPSSGKFQHAGQLIDLDGRTVGPQLNFGASDATGFDIQAIDGNAFSTIELLRGATGGAGLDPIVKYWELDGLAFGTSGNDSLDGVGVDAAILVGKEGDDRYSIDQASDIIVERPNQGTDRLLVSLSYVLPNEMSIELMSTTNNIGTDPINLTGNGSSQYIFGNYGANQLDGGFGGDVLIGFLGDDTYIVRYDGDDVRENVGEGTDRVSTAVSYQLRAGQEIELFATTSNVGVDALNLTGNEFAQYLFGNYGNNILDGRGGADVMLGFRGNDVYRIDDQGDDVRETVGEGADHVVTTVSFRLGAGQSVEFLEADNPAGTAAINLTGNELAQEITGNDGANVLRSGGGVDILYGRGGDDVYYITPDAILQEFGGKGYDRVFVSGGSYTLAGSEIEILTPEDEFGTDPYNFTGNGFAQYVYGNDGVNRLDGGGGGDVLVGRGGDDQLFIRNAADQIREDANDGSDRVFATVSWQLNAGAHVEKIATDNNLGTGAINLTGNEFAQYVYGNAGSHVVGGGGGRDVLNGLGGADTFLFNTALNTAFTSSFGSLADTANVDRIDEFAFDDKIALSGALFGLTPGTLSAGAFALGTTASEADDRILYDAATGALLFDADGAGGAAAQLFGFINGPFNLDSSYFVVV